MSPAFNSGDSFSTRRDFALAVWNWAAQEGYALHHEVANPTRDAFTCAEKHVPKYVRDTRVTCAFLLTATCKSGELDWTVSTCDLEHSCDPVIRLRRMDDSRRRARKKVQALSESSEETKRETSGGHVEEQDDGTTSELDRPVDDGRNARSGGKTQHRSSQRLKDKQSKDGKKTVKLPPELEFPTAAELRDDIQECIEAGETSLPSPDEDFAEGYRLAARLHTFAQTQGFVIRAVKVGSYRCAKSQCPVRLAGRWDADREVWRLTEQNLDHSHIISGSDGGADAMDVRGDADKEIGRLGSKTAATTATASPTPGAPLFETEEEQQASQSSPHSALPPTPRHRKTPAPCSPLPFDLECNAGPAPKDDGPAHEQTPRLSPTPSCRPIRRRHSSPSPSFPHQTAFADAPSQLKKPRLTIDTQYEAPKHQPPTPRSDFLSFDHLDSELGTLPFKDLLLGKGGITSVSHLARLAAFDGGSLGDFVAGFKLSEHKINGVDHSPLVERFVKALKKAVARDAAQLA
ncbi:hypothetical protein NBRC10512_004435 [Rhodotorula toruloides]|uniref:RHTO0S15e02872g1_1 n=2 Tax=Rhodotorula toruloides TaxID=5286 RepID=A0A061BD24_RHOTO|nr:uncharacterized protein RHTO_03179 [Rhodotorula toruloides NP11]EMS25450.1 hypothetical protein RHTO_03179 [Rhodotorula toruloides NP11]CDR47862.1 RHTO0S15e02872g1_1 [Rhodotorula toruloides]